MMRIRETVSKLTRHTKKTEKGPTDDKKRKGRFHKLKKNLNIFAKFKKKPSKSDEFKNEDVEFEEINVEDEQEENGFQVVQIKVEESKEINEPNNKHTVDADFHHDFNKTGDTGSELLLRHNSNEVLNPDRLSKASLVPCVSSRISVISQKSMSNASIISIRKEIQTRTVWTQTELKTADADVETGASIENMAKDECESIVTRSVDQSSYGSFEFGIDDIFSPEPVENPKLAAIRDRIVHRLKFPCLSQCDPEVCVDLLRYPKLPFLISLNRKLSMEEADFNELFIAFRGLDYLLYLMEEIATSGMDEFSDVMKMLLVSECATSLVNSTSGRDFIINHGEHVVSLARALETKNLMVKMQIFELLSALCVYSKDGYYLTLDALERYRSWQKLQYRMSVLVNEVRKSELTTYKTTIMALINAIIFANENIRDRVRIRNEFLALSILDTIQTLRCEDDEDLFVQCDVFEEELNADTDALEEAKNGTVNLNDPQSVFTAVHKKVQGTPLNATFLGILHSLLQIEPHNSQSESTWTLIERVTQDALSKDPLSDTDFAQTVIKNHSKETREQEIQTEENNRLSLLGTPSIAFPPPPSGPPSLESSTESTAPVPPPPPPLPSGTAQVPQAPPLPPTAPGVPGVPAPPAVPGIPGAPPPPPAPGVPGVPAPPPAPGVPGAPPPPAPPGVPGAPPPPAPPGVPGAPPPPGAGFQVAAVQPPKTIDTPRPSMKMKTIAWNKIPVNSFKKESVWGKVLDMKDSIDVEYSKFEELFSQKQVVSPAASLSPETAEKGVNRRNSGQNHGEVTLLDPKKSMNINIFLKQFRKTNDAIIELIKAGDVRGLGVEKLKGMLKLLPLQDEADMLQAYDGEVEKLGNAEKFFYSLIQLNGYKLRIETMILKGDFNSQLGSIRPNIQTLSTVCRKLIDNDSLQVFLRFVLHAGNFINGGSSSGGAIGFRISSLNKLVNMKSNQPKMTLLHVLVQEAQQKNKGALEFVSDLLEPLQKASRFTLDGMIGEFSTLKTSVVKIKGQIENASEEVQQQFSSFIQEAESDIKDVDEAIDRVQKLSVRLAVHYCENERSFKLDEFLEAFKEFCEKAKSCEQEIETWRINAEKAELRRQTQAQMMERRKSGNRQGMVQGSDQEKHKIVDNLVNEIRRGKVLRRLSLRRNVTDEEIAASGKK